MQTATLTIKTLASAVENHYMKMLAYPAFEVDFDRDYLKELYLKSFPQGTDPMYKVRTQHDCNICKSFIKNVGGLVWVVDNQLVSIWDLEIEGPYKVVAEALSAYIKSKNISNVFLSHFPKAGTKSSKQFFESTVLNWDHLSLTFNSKHVSSQVDKVKGDYKTTYQMLNKALTDISFEALEIVLDLIAQNSLYRGQEKKGIVKDFYDLKNIWKDIPFSKRHNFVWSAVVTQPINVCRIKNDVIGTLLFDLSEGVDFEKAVKSFEDKVSGTNYQRPTALVTTKMKQDAEKAVVELGLMDSLFREPALIEDLPLSEVLYTSGSNKKLNTSVFDEIQVHDTTPTFNQLKEMGLEDFINNVLPSAKDVEVYFDNNLVSNLVSLIKPSNPSAKPLLKWDNGFSWSYKGEVADAVKERVAKAGGNVTGELRVSLSWDHGDDLDLHLTGPIGHIYFSNKIHLSSGGRLDVDRNISGWDPNPVENIYFPMLASLPSGDYTAYVRCYSSRKLGGTPGFNAQIQVLDSIYNLAYPQTMKQGEEVIIANFRVQLNTYGQKEVVVSPQLSCDQLSQKVWNLDTLKFHKVRAITQSPNYWNGNKIGNRHLFFFLDQCINDDPSRGFYNEFLSSELTEYRKVLELVGSKVKVTNHPDQLNGVGFSTTLQKSFIVKVKTSFTQVLKINI